MNSNPGTTRLAPSPTGALHLGNLRTFLVNWALARRLGWRIILRIEDLDGPRVKLDTIDETIDVLHWMGLEWDEGPYFQSRDLAPYRDALIQLAAAGQIYPCRCSRKQRLAASLSAPHGDDQEPRYSGTCRPPIGTTYSASELDDPECGWRFRVPDQEITWADHFAGRQFGNVAREVGDFLVASKNGLPSYQLAVVIDDARQRVDRIVRGDDLLSSVARQRSIYDALQLGPLPEYWHLPLVRGQDGRRLAKRHGDTRVTKYRQLGVPAARLVALIGAWCGIESDTGLMTLSEFTDRFELARVPPSAIDFVPTEDAWLLAQASA